MEHFIHPRSVIRYSPNPLPPTPDEAIGLTSDSIWSWFIHCLGWHEPALPERIKRIIRRHFESLPFPLRRLLIRPDLLPHRHFPPGAFRSDEPVILSLYRLTAAIRALSVRHIHRFSCKPINNRVDKYSDAHRLWVPEAELSWLRMRDGMREAAEGKCIDFPIALKFTVCQPQDDFPERSKCTIRTMTLHEVPGDGYWPVEFFQGSRVDNENGQATISFSRTMIARSLGINLPPTLEKLGHSWVENLSWGPKNRVLFRKVCSDDQIGILLWPSLPDKSQSTPRIPVYKKDIIELVHGDRLLIFVGPKRGLDDASIMITITAHWASTQDSERTYADIRYVIPNPCERYPHCVRRPIYKPVIALDPVNEENQVIPKSDYTSSQMIPEERPSQSSSDETYDKSILVEPLLGKQPDENDIWTTEITVEVLDEAHTRSKLTAEVINEDHEARLGGDINKAISINTPSKIAAEVLGEDYKSGVSGDLNTAKKSSSGEDINTPSKIKAEVLDEDHQSGVDGDVNKAKESTSGQEINTSSAVKAAASAETTTKRKRQSRSASVDSSKNAKQARNS